LNGLNCTIEKVFGRYLIVIRKSGKESTELIELGSPDYSRVVTTLQFDSFSDYQIGIEANFHKDNFLVKYVKKHHRFEWDSFEQLTFVHLYDRGCITQLFNNFSMTLKVDSMKLEVREVGGNQLLKTIDLPLDIKLQNTVRNFLPVGMSKKSGQLENDGKVGLIKRLSM
jgi:hypothetical protein